MPAVNLATGAKAPDTGRLLLWTSVGLERIKTVAMTLSDLGVAHRLEYRTLRDLRACDHAFRSAGFGDTALCDADRDWRIDLCALRDQAVIPALAESGGCMPASQGQALWQGALISVQRSDSRFTTSQLGGFKPSASPSW